MQPTRPIEDLVSEIGDLRGELGNAVNMYNAAVEDLNSVMADSSPDTLDIDVNTDDADEIDGIENDMVDSYSLERDVSAAIQSLSAAAEEIDRIKSELVTALHERNEPSWE